MRAGTRKVARWCAAAVVVVFVAGCVTQRPAPTDPQAGSATLNEVSPSPGRLGQSLQTDDQKAQAFLEENRRGLAENEAIKSKLEPFVQVRDGQYVLLPGASGVVDPKIVDALQSRLAELNALAQKGDIAIGDDREITMLRSVPPSQTLACWRGVTYHWWGLKVGMSSTDISVFLTAWRTGGCTALAASLLAIPGAGPFIGTLSYVYCNGVMVYLGIFHCCICHGSCEIATIYWWSLLTPFLSCQ